jgi:hypothetical protein
MGHTLESAGQAIGRLRQLRMEAGRAADRFEVTLSGQVNDPEDVQRWEETGVDRLIVSPWKRSPEAIEGLRRFSELIGL